MAGAGKYYYYVSAREDEKKAEKVKVTFTEKTTFSSEKTAAIETRKIDSITITISELLDCAKEMKDMHPDDYCYNILQSNVVKAVNEGKVSECKELSIAQTVNIVGMVGSGKSTFIKVLSYCFNKYIIASPPIYILLYITCFIFSYKKAKF